MILHKYMVCVSQEECFASGSIEFSKNRMTNVENFVPHTPTKEITSLPAALFWMEFAPILYETPYLYQEEDYALVFSWIYMPTHN